MSDVVVVEAVRSPLGKRKGGLSGTHSVELLAKIQAELVARSGIDPLEIGQVVGGCVGQVGMQTMNVTRNAWLTAGPAHRGRLPRPSTPSAAPPSRPRTWPTRW